MKNADRYWAQDHTAPGRGPGRAASTRLLAPQEMKMKNCPSQSYQKLWNIFSVYIKQDKSLNTLKLLLTRMTLHCTQDQRIHKTYYLKTDCRQRDLQIGHKLKAVLLRLPLKAGDLCEDSLENPIKGLGLLAPSWPVSLHDVKINLKQLRLNDD